MDRMRQCARWDDRHRHECGFAMQRTSRITARRTGKEKQASPVRSALAVVPQIDHRRGNGFECVVQLTETFKAQQQAPELVFPGEQPLDGTEPLFEDGAMAYGLAWDASYGAGSD
jgi:hypothetical protein